MWYRENDDAPICGLCSIINPRIHVPSPEQLDAIESICSSLKIPIRQSPLLRWAYAEAAYVYDCNNELNPRIEFKQTQTVVWIENVRYNLPAVAGFGENEVKK